MAKAKPKPAARKLRGNSLKHRRRTAENNAVLKKYKA